MNTREELAAKHERLLECLEAQSLEVALLSRRCNFSWYTCGRARNYVGTAEDAGNSTLLVGRDGAQVVANTIEATRLGREDLPALGLGLVEYPWEDPAARAAAFERAIGPRRAGTDAPLAGVEA